ncbi:MAG: molybdopterin-dependent oxidoreductase, partial [Pseudomonadota bacterium]|nr:molybdopterin-dependent oxidoreductase [Pseudomonadota bacterium]
MFRLPAPTPSRRGFLKGAASAGLVVGFHWPLGRLGTEAAAQAGGFAPNAFLRIAPDNSVTVICKHIEFGQGPYTGLATIVADELDADWAQIRVESAPADASRYNNLAFGQVQGTGGSTAIGNSWDQLRQAGAEARAKLVAAAAEAWGAQASEITVENGMLRHTPSARSASFGELAERAARVTLTGEAKPKHPSRWRYIGKHVPKVDKREKVDCTALYTLDVRLPDMLTCVVERPDRFGAKVKSFDASEAMKIKGVVEVVAIPEGVAVLAKGFWPARKGREALTVEWDESGAETRSTDTIFAEYRALAKTPGKIGRNDGDVGPALAQAVRTVEAIYDFPFLAHAPMEPDDCVIRRAGDGVELLFGSQLQTVDQSVVAQTLGLKPEQVAIKTLLAGGSFGRRATPSGDMALEAAHVFKAMKHQGPVKVVWTREDDIKGGRYRPVYVHRLKAGLDGKGNIVGWEHVIVGQSILVGSPFQVMIKDEIDGTSVEGATTLPYAIPNLRVSLHTTKVGVPVLWWRSVGSRHTAFSCETFLDEVAVLAGMDSFYLFCWLLNG